MFLRFAMRCYIRVYICKSETTCLNSREIQKLIIDSYIFIKNFITKKREITARWLHASTRTTYFVDVTEEQVSFFFIAHHQENIAVGFNLVHSSSLVSTFNVVWSAFMAVFVRGWTMIIN